MQLWLDVSVLRKTCRNDTWLLSPTTGDWAKSGWWTLSIIVLKTETRDTCEFPGSWFHNLYIEEGQKRQYESFFPLLPTIWTSTNNLENYQVFRLYQDQLCTGPTLTGYMFPLFPYSSWMISSLPSFYPYLRTIWTACTRLTAQDPQHTCPWGKMASMAAKKGD